MRVYKTTHPFYCGVYLHAIPVQPGDPVECESEWVVPENAPARDDQPDPESSFLFKVGWS